MNLPNPLATIFSSLGGEPQVGINPGLHPHGNAPAPFDPLAMLNLLQQGRNDMFQNMRSPTVRRTVGGALVDESKPQGLDSLRDIGHSWDEDRSGRASIGSGRISSDEPTPFNADVRLGTGGKAIMGEYGGGYSSRPVMGYSPFQTEPIETYGDGSEYDKVPTQAMSGPFSTQEGYTDQRIGGSLQRNIQSAYNQAIQSPFEIGATPLPKAAPPPAPNRNATPGAAPSVPKQNTPITPEMRQGLPKPPATPPPSLPPIPSPITAESPFSGPAGSPYGMPGEQLDDMSDYAVAGDNPGFLPDAGRKIGLGGAKLLDWLMNRMWRSGSDTYPIQEDFTNRLLKDRNDAWRVNSPLYTP